ncbi:MAG: tripartite tricarboxylate transporter substrate binding protein [Rhodospirillum sp.]|nr:tripartite tricarboxylate transporter substrate binding protein [Rhodospirillum sp.]MCF8491469.1 tripartite tricarboxylate transporter substrate binding protein [Rhodospirillum sp.]MCF8498877.1 tripartite tricarboxylate transporter substrate binding protein [Rhodospirillum sp.]
MTSIRFPAALALAAGLVFSPALAGAQEKPADFPQRPINMIVMYPAGGAVDVTARTVAKLADDRLGEQFRVENRVGGAGMVGHTYLAKNAKPDGYTIGVIANPFMFTDILLRDAPFSKDEFEPIASISFDPVIWVVNAKSEVGQKDFPGIVEYAKSHTLQVGMNPNSMFLFVSEFIEKAKDVTFNFIPFDGGRQGVTALLAGDVDATAAFYSEIEQYIRNGDLKAVAVTGDERHPLMPDVPTFDELGVPASGHTWGASRFLTLPPGVPEDRKAWLESAFMEVLESDEAKQAFADAGLTLSPTGAEETKASYEDTYQSLEGFLKSSGRLSK